MVSATPDTQLYTAYNERLPRSTCQSGSGLVTHRPGFQPYLDVVTIKKCHVWAGPRIPDFFPDSVRPSHRLLQVTVQRGVAENAFCNQPAVSWRPDDSG